MRIKNIVLSRYLPRDFERHAVKGRDLIGVEIGVYEGEHAESMLKNLKIKTLYLVDPFQEYKDFSTKYNDFFSKELMNEIKQKAIKKLRKWKNIKWVFKTSSEASKDVLEDLDFVYIDGAHDYENVKLDIKKYWPKLKKGGVLGGDDFFNGHGKAIPAHSGLINAVLEFVTKYKLQLYVQGRDWWVYKK